MRGASFLVPRSHQRCSHSSREKASAAFSVPAASTSHAQRCQQQPDCRWTMLSPALAQAPGSTRAPLGHTPSCPSGLSTHGVVPPPRDPSHVARPPSQSYRHLPNGSPPPNLVVSCDALLRSLDTSPAKLPPQDLLSRAWYPVLRGWSASSTETPSQRFE